MPIIQAAVAWVAFCVVAIVKLHPMIPHLGTHISDPGDPLLVSWILAWGFHALTTDPWNLFQANIFYPAETTLAFSEHLLGVLPIFAPAYALTGNPIFAYNMVFFLSFPLSGLSMFLLVHYWTRSFWASLLAGALFAFAPLRFTQYAHLHLLNLYWAPLALLFLDRFLRRQRWRDLIGLAVFYWMQVLCSVYLGWFTTIALALYWLCYIVFIDRNSLGRPVLVPYASFAALSLAVLLPFHLPYFEVQRQWGITRMVCHRAELRGRHASICHAALTLLCLGVFFLELGFRSPIPLVKIDTAHEIPEVYRWLAAKQPGPIVELPIGMWENFPYMYFSTYHWLPIVNGWSGFVPPTYMEIVAKLHDLPSQKAVDFLSAAGVGG
jgi:hypothetical protein